MTTERASFGKRVVGNTTYSLIDLVLTKISTTIVFIMLVRLLPDSDIAAIGIAMGYLVFISYMDVAPIRVLLRDYPEVSKDNLKRDELLTALFVFWILQSVAMFIICIALNIFVLNELEVTGLGFLFFAMTADFVALSIQGWIKLVYYTDFRQRVATLISLFFTIGRLISYGVLLLFPSLVAYSWILIITAAVACVIWSTAFVLHFDYKPVVDKNTPGILLRSLKDYGLWDHFNRTIIDTLFVVDTIILAAIGHMRDIGNYTIALKFTSLLAIIPAQLSHGLQMVLSNYNTNEKRHDALNTFIKVNGLISLGQLLFIIVFGEWLIKLLFGHGIQQDVVYFSIIIATGVTVFNFGFPFVSIVNTYCKISEAFLIVFMPALIAGVLIYVIAALNWGAIGMAYGNIVTYLILTIALMLFVYNKYPFPFRFELISDREKFLLHELFHKGKNK